VGIATQPRPAVRKPSGAAVVNVTIRELKKAVSVTSERFLEFLQEAALQAYAERHDDD